MRLLFSEVDILIYFKDNSQQTTDNGGPSGVMVLTMTTDNGKATLTTDNRQRTTDNGGERRDES